MTGVWSQLRSAALIGSARAQLPVIDVDGATSALITHVDATETSALLAAGALALARRSGVAPVPDGALPAPAPAADLPVPPEPARRRLRGLLDGVADVEHLTLWLELAADRGLRAPARELPALFQLARVQHALRPLTVAVAGERGRWLASQRPEWHWVANIAIEVDAADDRMWQEGSLAERTAYLTAVRACDAAAGRARLEDVWPTEPPAERAAFLPVLANGLSRDDEAFCEAALDDRRKEVRAVAAGLLAEMDGSAYQRRMVGRARSYVIAGRKITVRPPAECDLSMRRDGVEAKPPVGAGERAWWLEQVVAATPLAAWSEFGKSPAHILDMRTEPGWQLTLHRAWARAAVRTRDADWAEALIDSGFGVGKGAEMHDVVLAASLYDVLPPAVLVDRTMRLLSATEPPDLGALGTVLDACPRPWPSQLAEALLRLLYRQVRQVDQSYVSPRFRTLAATIVNGLAVDAIDSFRALTEHVRVESKPGPAGDSQAVRLMDSLLINLSVRHTMFQEFA